MSHFAKPDSRAASVWAALAVIATMGANFLPCRALARSAQPESPQSIKQALIAVVINGAPTGMTLVALTDTQGGVWLAGRDFAKLRLRTPSAPRIEEGGERFYLVSGLPGAGAHLDQANDELVITVPAAAFLPSAVSMQGQSSPPISPITPGMFLNYEASAQNVGGESTTGILANLGLFSRAGVLSNTAVVREEGGTGQMIRLDTAFRRDYPGHLVTLTLGDTISDPGSFGSAVRFGGIHFGTDFGLRPDLVTTPLLTAQGSALVPSTVDVFVNNSKVGTEQVPAGPFAIADLPGVSGAGTVRLVVRNAIGAEQVITEPFYSGANLLSAGRSQYSIDLGPVRENYDAASFGYQSLLASGTYRRGLTNSTTLEIHGEALDDKSRAAGISVEDKVGTLGILTATMAAGGNAQASGWLSSLGFERYGQRGSFAVKSTYASDGYHQAADSLTTQPQFKSQDIVEAGWNWGRGGSTSLAYAAETYRDYGRQQTVSLAQNVSLGEKGFVSLSVGEERGAISSKFVNLTFTWSLSSRLTLSDTTLTGEGDGEPHREMLASLTQMTPVGVGTGWRFAAATDGDFDMHLETHLPTDSIELEAARTAGVTGTQVDIQGALTYLDGDLAVSREISGSYAVVDLDGLAHVPIFVDNHLVADTNANGKAVIYDLLPDQENRISIQPQDLPLDTTIGASQVQVVPAYDSGVVVNFPVKRIHPALFRLVTQAGQPLPAGARVRLNGEEVPVALNGTVYITRFGKTNSGLARFDSAACSFVLPTLPKTAGALPDLGTVVCRSKPSRYGDAR